MSRHAGRFHVTDHYELSSRGAFVIGTIREGSVGVGMIVSTGTEPATLKISGMECLDNLSEKQSFNAIIYAERPSMEFIKRAFSVGSLIEVLNR